MEYPKIDTLFERNEKFIVDTSRFRRPVFCTIGEWDVTEKVDGTNIRVMMDEQGLVTFGGRTDRAQLHTDLLQYLMATFTADKMTAAFIRDDGGLPSSVVLYGEGYGAGIQKGGSYRPDKAFRLFDVLVDGRWWLSRENIADVANKLSIQRVPYLGRWSTEQIVNYVAEGMPSVVANEDMNNSFTAEGVVARTVEELFDNRGKRIMFKLKTRDFGRK